jgi:hypothetical protein
LVLVGQVKNILQVVQMVALQLFLVFAVHVGGGGIAQYSFPQEDTAEGQEVWAEMVCLVEMEVLLSGTLAVEAEAVVETPLVKV